MLRKLLTTVPFSLDLGLAIIRLAFGVALAIHGWGKVKDIDPFIAGLRQMNFPAPEILGWAAAISEFFGGILFAAGLLTRFAAIFAGTTMAVAMIKVHGSDPFEKKEPAMLYLAAFLAIFLTGPGKMSLDSLIAGSGGSRKGGSPKT